MKLFLSSDFSTSGNLLPQLTDLYQTNKKVGFISNAADILDDQSWVNESRNKFIELGCEVINIDLRTTQNDLLRLELEKVDLIYVEGGNNVYLLEISNRSGFTEIIKDQVKIENKIYIGTSAGSTHAGPSIESTMCLDDDYKSSELKSYDALGLVNFTVIPHIGGWFQNEYKEKYNQMFDNLDKYLYPHICLRDNQVVWVEDNRLTIIGV